MDGRTDGRREGAWKFFELLNERFFPQRGELMPRIVPKALAGWCTAEWSRALFCFRFPAWTRATDSVLASGGGGGGR